MGNDPVPLESVVTESLGDAWQAAKATADVLGCDIVSLHRHRSRPPAARWQADAVTRKGARYFAGFGVDEVGAVRALTAKLQRMAATTE